MCQKVVNILKYCLAVQCCEAFCNQSFLNTNKKELSNKKSGLLFCNQVEHIGRRSRITFAIKAEEWSSTASQKKIHPLIT